MVHLAGGARFCTYPLESERYEDQNEKNILQFKVVALVIRVRHCGISHKSS